VSRPVFISYARVESRDEARALYEELGGREGPAFLDTEDIELGEQFPQRLIDGVLQARVVVVFLSAGYLGRWYCIRELRLALSEFEASIAKPEATAAEKAEALAGIVIALPPGRSDGLLDHLPPQLRTAAWPLATDTERLAELVNLRLSASPASRAASPEETRSLVAATLLEEAAIPSPVSLAQIPSYPQALAPSLGDGFFGRADDLWRIHFALSTLREAPGRAALTGSLEGGGGFGKTRLALEYVHRFGAKHYPGGVFWIDAEGDEDRLETQFHGALRVLHPEIPELIHFREQERDAHAELGAALEQASLRAPVLMVVDNVPESPAGTSPRPLATWCPAIGKIALLATSRTSVSLESNAVRPLRIDVLPRAASVALLANGLPDGEVDRDALGRVAGWVGDLPLALELLNRALRTGLQLPELIQKMEDSGPARELDEQMDALRSHVPQGALRGITEAFSISYELLSPDARKAARLIARLAPDAVPLELLNALGPDVSSAPVRTALTARSFMTPARPVGVPVIGRMHRVLADFLRGRSGQPEQEANLVGSELLELLPPGGLRDPREWPRFEALRPHAEQIFHDVVSGRSPGDADTATQLASRVAELLMEQGAARSAEAILREAAAHAERILGAEDYGTLALQNQLAELVRLLGRYDESREMNRSVLATVERRFGVSDELTVASLQNLALAEHDAGDQLKAIELLQRAVEAARDVFGPQHAATLRAMTNLARMLEMEGRYDEAGDLFERALDVQLKLFGPDDADAILTQSGLALNQTNRGAHAKALALHEDLVKRCVRLYGEKHPTTLIARGHLAWTLHKLGKNEAALEHLRSVIEAQHAVLGRDHPDTLTAEGNLVMVLRTIGRDQEAEEIEQAMFDRLQATHGADHPSVLIRLDNMAVSLAAKGQFQKAESLQRRVVNGLSATLGPHNRDTLAAMSNLAFSLHELGEFKEAAQLEQQVVEGHRQLAGDRHPDTLSVEAAYARTLYEIDRAAEAAALLAGIAERVTASDGQQETVAQHLVPILRRFANLLLSKGRLTGAQGFLETAFAISQRLLGDDHPDTLEAMTNLGSILYKRKDYRAAYRWQKRSFDKLSVLVGAKDARLTRAAWGLLLTLDGLGRGKEATQLLRDRLLWLFRENPADLDPSQRQIAALLYQYVQP
jgi:tetratricopeptide (TPR) repeat protein